MEPGLLLCQLRLGTLPFGLLRRDSGALLRDLGLPISAGRFLAMAVDDLIPSLIQLALALLQARTLTCLW